MNKVLVCLAVTGVVIAVYVFSGNGDVHAVSVSGDEVTLETRDLDVRFRRAGSLDEAYMIFGGSSISDGNAISSVTLAGLNVRDARVIATSYPNFHRCDSRGAALAKRMITQLDLVPSEKEALKVLRRSVDEHAAHVRGSGERVFVRIVGERLKLESIRVREEGLDITEKHPGKNLTYFLVTSAERLDASAALGTR